MKKEIYHSLKAPIGVHQRISAIIFYFSPLPGQYLLFLFLFSNCLTLKPPAITFTQTQTAAEKQMLGGEKDIEKDGWIISSIRTSSSGSEIWEKQVLDKDIHDQDMDDSTFIALRKLSYLSGEMREYKKKGFIGESLDGTVKINPIIKESKFQKEFPALKPRIEDLLKNINESRQVVYNKRIQLMEKEKFKEQEIPKIKSNYLLKYYKSVEDGEFYESKQNSWTKK